MSFLKSKRVIAILVLTQLITVYLMATGVWPDWVGWVNMAVLSIYILAADPFDALLATVVSLPFFVALPNPYLEGFPGWRLIFIWLAMAWAVKKFIINKDYKFQPLPKWDIYGVGVIIIALLSIVFARFPVQGLKQIIFIINAGLVYFLIGQIVTTREKITTVIKYLIYSLGTIVALGYLQFIITLFASPYYFWQYWAIMVSKIYYGLDLANVLIYSNSWFSYTGGSQSLRMFSIMPDSHSFSVVAMFLLVFIAAYKITPPTPLNLRGEKEEVSALAGPPLGLRGARGVILLLSALAIILSGTRGIWVAMLAPLTISLFWYWRGKARQYLKPLLVGFGMVLLIFAASPLLDRAVATIRNVARGGSFLDRAASIYDLSEQSNIGRLEIWQESFLYAVRHPLGTGYGNFIVSLHDEILPDVTIEQLAGQKDIRFNLPEKFVTAHSLYLHLLVELGVIGLVIFLFFCLKIFLEIGKHIKLAVAKNDPHAAWLVCVPVALLWLLAYGVFDVTLFNDKILIYTFITIGLTGAVINIRKT